MTVSRSRITRYMEVVKGLNRGDAALGDGCIDEVTLLVV